MLLLAEKENKYPAGKNVLPVEIPLIYVKKFNYFEDQMACNCKGLIIRLFRVFSFNGNVRYGTILYLVKQ